MNASATRLDIEIGGCRYGVEWSAAAGRWIVERETGFGSWERVGEYDYLTAAKDAARRDAQNRREKG